MLKKKENNGTVKRVVVHRIMPPGLPDNNIDSARIQALTPEGNLIEYPAELIQFGKAAGTSMGGNRHSGYDVRHNSNFVLCINNEGKICNIHIFPKYDFSSQAPPAFLADQELIEGKLDQNTGDITVTIMPMSVRTATLVDVLSKIDDCAELMPGQAISSTCTVDSVAGNEFKLRLNISPTQAVTTLSQVMRENAGI